MKKIMLIAALGAIVASGHAQTEQLYIYRNDNAFEYFRGADIKGFSYGGPIDGYTSLTVATDEGSTVVNLAAVDSCVVRAAGIPDIHVHLTEFPDIPDLFKTGGYTKSTVYKANLRMDGNGMYDDVPEQTVEFRGRGNSTWTFEKTPYRFKMSKKASVCGLPKAKTYALIANYIDGSHMRNVMALWLARELGLPYSNHAVPVNVYLNNNFKGLYMLTEKIGIGGGSVDIDEEAGMLFELDVAFDEDYRFVYSYAGGTRRRLPVNIKDPDLAEIKPDKVEREQYLSQWQADFSAMADAVFGAKSSTDLSGVIDIDDAVRYMLVYSVTCNSELCHPKSLYMYKKALGESETYHFGPAWDFDWAYDYVSSGDGVNGYDHVALGGDGDYSGASFMKAIASTDRFRAAYKAAWTDFRDNIYPRMMEYFASYARLIEPAAKRDGVQWPDIMGGGWAFAPSSLDHAARVRVLAEWLRGRVEWCDRHPNWGLY